MNLSDFDFSVPAELIAKHPLKNRDRCRLLVVRRTTEATCGERLVPVRDEESRTTGLQNKPVFEHRQFSDLLEYLQPGDVLVLNDAKVNKSRFFATRPTGGKVEVLLTRHVQDFVGAGSPRPGEETSPLQNNVDGFSSLSLRRRGTVGEVVGAGPRACPGVEGRPQGVAPTKTKQNQKAWVWEAIISHSARVKEGEFLTLNGNCRGGVTPPLQQNGNGFRILSKQNGRAFVQIESETDIFEKYGTVPIPPYLQRSAEKEDEEDYQTVFARTPGASAAPTAGLHFTPELLEKIKSKGVEIAYLSLLVGPGTFEPIRGDDISRHKMHAEYFEIGEEICAKINSAKKSGRKIWAVGTTVVKALETAARFNDETDFPPRVGEGLRERSFSGDSDLFIYPPFDFKIVDGLITNFHWPRSTLVLLVAAFAGKSQVLSAYNEAITQRYRFFSYGDAMLIYR